ncbi:peptidase inhibitor family I36 protein [Paractinoplanes atraurantiacus]|uniref:Peptidase inhibitor family I36 n=1 Tax=Paractinoplanes atraurantiacus TaxID=1036182 RepID=A0A285KCX8_9ACTN|nr:peptidase inhibitor family I36 protein [Actinoplanes atraurantiacus]SNY69787.1 Peptidase inhibitor family I36 [Actinoplanes atraurantiacus]
MKKRVALKGVLGSLLAVVASSAVVSSPAQAAPYKCGTNGAEVCFYSNPNLQGTVAVPGRLKTGDVWKRYMDDFNGWTFYNGDGLNDAVSSVWNRTPYHLAIYEHRELNSGRSGGMLMVPPGERVNVINGLVGLYDNTASSARLFPY